MSEIKIGYKKNDFLWNVDSCDGTTCELNKSVSQKLMDIQHVHNGADKRYTNSQELFNRLMLDRMNLGIGVIGCVVFIYYNYDVIKPKT